LQLDIKVDFIFESMQQAYHIKPNILPVDTSQIVSQNDWTKAQVPSFNHENNYMLRIHFFI